MIAPRRRGPRKSVDGGRGASTTVRVRLSEPQARKLRRMADHWGCSRSEALRRMIDRARKR